MAAAHVIESLFMEALSSPRTDSEFADDCQRIRMLCTIPACSWPGVRHRLRSANNTGHVAPSVRCAASARAAEEAARAPDALSAYTYRLTTAGLR